VCDSLVVHLHTFYFIEAELSLREQVHITREQSKWFGIRNRGSRGTVIRLDVRFVNGSSQSHLYAYLLHVDDTSMLNCRSRVTLVLAFIS